MVGEGAFVGCRPVATRLFETRAAVLQAVAEERIELAAKRLCQAFADYDDIEDALVRGSLKSMVVGRSDAVLDDIQQQADHSVDQYMFRGSPRAQELMVDLWGPLLDTARAEGKVRDSIGNGRAVEWIRNVHAMLTMRVDYSETKAAEMLRDFLVLAIIQSPR